MSCSRCGDTREPAGFVDAALNLLRQLAVGIELHHLFPVANRAREVLAVEGDRACQRQRLEVVRFDGQCLVDQAAGLALQIAPIGHGQCIGIVRQQYRVVAAQRDGLLQGRRGLLVAAEHGIGPTEHGPAIDVVGLVLQPRGQVLDHRLDLRCRDRWRGTGRRGGACSHGCVQRLRRAKPQVASDRDREDERPQTEQQGLGIRGCGSGGWRRRIDHGVGDATLERLARFVVRRVAEHARLLQRRELLKLLAQGVERRACRRCRRTGPGGAPKRACQRRQGQRDEQRADHDKKGHGLGSPAEDGSASSGAWPSTSSASN